MSYAYSVAIKLSVANLATQGLRLLTGDLLAAHGAASKLEEKLKALKMIAVGYGLEKIGAGTIGFLEKSIKASKEYTSQLSLMNAAGMSQQEIALATASAWKTSRDVLTTTAADNLKAIRELRSVFGVDHMSEAYGILPAVQRASAIQEALTGQKQENVGFDMVKAIELRTPGVMTREALNRNVELMTRSVMAFGGTINVNDFHMAMKQLKATAFGFSDDFVYKYLPTLIQEAKTNGGSGSSAATALRTLSNAMIGGVGINKASIPVWEAMGLIKPSDVVRNATGQFGLRPHAVKDVGLYQKNPELWAQKHAPEVYKYGADNHLSLLETVMAMYKNTNAQFAMYTLLAKQPQFERDKKLIESGGTGIEMYQQLMKTNPQLAEEALHAQWQNVLSILGYQILPRLIPYMVKFADWLDRASQWMAKNGPLTEKIAFSLAGVGIALSVIGKVMLTAGIIKFLGIGPVILAALTPLGLAAAAITAVGVAGYELYKHWAWVKEQLGLGDDWQGSAGHRERDGKAADVWSGTAGHHEKSTQPRSDRPGSAFVNPARSIFSNPPDKRAGESRFIQQRAAVNSNPMIVKLMLKERVLGEFTMDYINKNLARPPSGGSNFDPTMHLQPVALNHDH